MNRIRRKGFTLIELMVVVAIMGVIILSAPKIFTKTYQFVQLFIARAEIQKNARGALSNINRDLRQAQSANIVIDSLPGQPPHSRITFPKLVQGGGTATVTYYQKGNALFQGSGTGEGHLVASNLRYVAFTYPRTDDDSIISVSITFEKATYEGGTKALQMAVEKVRIMN